MSKRTRRSRAKPVTNDQLARIEEELANVTEAENPYAQWVRPQVDREALLRAVHYPQFQFALNLELGRDTINLDDAGRWRRLCLIRAAMRELRKMEQELGEVVPVAQPNDPRNRTPVTKETLWRLTHPGREPRNTAEVSRWYAREVFPFVDPSVSDPASRKRLTINLRLFAERFGLLLDDLRRTLP